MIVGSELIDDVIKSNMVRSEIITQVDVRSFILAKIDHLGAAVFFLDSFVGSEVSFGCVYYFNLEIVKCINLINV